MRRSKEPTPLREDTEAYRTLRGSVEGELARPSVGGMQTVLGDWKRAINSDWGKSLEECSYLIEVNNEVKPIWKLIQDHLQNEWQDLADLTGPDTSRPHPNSYAELIRRLWRTYFIAPTLLEDEKAKVFEKAKMLDYLENRLHQGGEIAQVEAAMAEILTLDNKAKGPDTKITRTFRRDGERLVLDVTTKIADYLDLADPVNPIAFNVPLIIRERYRIGLGGVDRSGKTKLEMMEVLSIPDVLKRAMEPEITSEKKSEWLKYSLAHNHVLLLKSLLKQDNSLLQHRISGENVLHLAFEHGAISCIKELSKYSSGSFDVLLREKNEKGKTPIQVGIKNNVAAVLQQFSLQELIRFSEEAPPLLTSADLKTVAQFVAQHPHRAAAAIAKSGKYSSASDIEEMMVDFITNSRFQPELEDLWHYVEEMSGSPRSETSAAFKALAARRATDAEDHFIRLVHESQKRTHMAVKRAEPKRTCIMEWEKIAEFITINGRKVSELQEFHDLARIWNDGHGNEDEAWDALVALWKEHFIPKDASPEAKAAAIDFFAHHFHQTSMLDSSGRIITEEVFPAVELRALSVAPFEIKFTLKDGELTLEQGCTIGATPEGPLDPSLELTLTTTLSFTESGVKAKEELPKIKGMAVPLIRAYASPQFPEPSDIIKQRDVFLLERLKRREAVSSISLVQLTESDYDFLLAHFNPQELITNRSLSVKHAINILKKYCADNPDSEPALLKVLFERLNPNHLNETEKTLLRELVEELSPQSLKALVSEDPSSKAVKHLFSLVFSMEENKKFALLFRMLPMDTVLQHPGLTSIQKLEILFAFRSGAYTFLRVASQSDITKDETINRLLTEFLDDPSMTIANKIKELSKIVAYLNEDQKALILQRIKIGDLANSEVLAFVTQHFTMKQLFSLATNKEDIFSLYDRLQQQFADAPDKLKELSEVIKAKMKTMMGREEGLTDEDKVALYKAFKDKVKLTLAEEVEMISSTTWQGIRKIGPLTLECFSMAAILHMKSKEGFAAVAHTVMNTKPVSPVALHRLIEAIPMALHHEKPQDLDSTAAERLVLLLKFSIVNTKWKTFVRGEKRVFGGKTLDLPKHVAKMFDALEEGARKGEWEEALHRVSAIGHEAAKTKSWFRYNETHEFYKRFNPTSHFRREMGEVREGAPPAPHEEAERTDTPAPGSH